MIDSLVYYFPFAAWLICFFIIVVKIILYIRFKSTSDKWMYIVYFPYMNLALTSSKKKKNAKIFQNRLSEVIFFLLILSFALKYLTRN